MLFSVSVSPFPGAVFSVADSVLSEAAASLLNTALYSARDHGVFPVYLFSVPELNSGCFFVLMPSAKEFGRWGMEGERRRRGRNANKASSIPQRNVCECL